MHKPKMCENIDPDAFIFDDLLPIEDDKLLEQLLAEDSVPPENDVNNASGGGTGGTDEHLVAKKKRRGKSAVADQEITIGAEGSNSSTRDLKKAMHRAIEKQRRQEMSALFASLRSLLPLEYIKGKRSTSDHMNEAVKYINHMQAKLEGMRNHRDRLRNAASSSQVGAQQVVNVCDSTSFVKINSLGQEFEILISSGFACEVFPLSSVIRELLERGLNVVNCVSTRVDQRSLHKIQFEVNGAPLDLLELQTKLENLSRFPA